MNDIEQHLQKLMAIAMDLISSSDDPGLGRQIKGIVDDIENDLDDVYLQGKADAAREEWRGSNAT